VPNDKDMKKQLDKCIEELDKRARNGDPLDGKNENKAEKKSKKASSTKSPTKSNSTSSSSATKTETSTTNTYRDDDEEENIGGHVRGYKTTSDGRKTTFFNNELDEKTKALIGDIAPKTISKSTDLATPTVAQGTSAWNMAGTFESRDYSKWARDHIKSSLASVECTIDMEGGVTGTALLSSVSSVTGDAEVASARGKTKYIYDMTAECKWEFTVTTPESPHSPMTGKGTITITDITGDYEYEFQTTIDTSTAVTTQMKSFIQTYIRKKSKGGLQEACCERLKLFHRDFVNKCNGK
jgi:activator of HSP90 ATPase